MNEKSSLVKRGLLYVPVGAIITYILLSIVVGSPGDTLFLIGASIICTLGIGLIIWLPLWYGIGYVAILIFQGLTHRQIELPAKEPDHPGLTNDQRALIDYIHQATAKGLNQQKIIENLRVNGWSSDSIDWAFNFVSGEGNS